MQESGPFEVSKQTGQMLIQDQIDTFTSKFSDPRKAQYAMMQQGLAPTMHQAEIMMDLSRRMKLPSTDKDSISIERGKTMMEMESKSSAKLYKEVSEPDINTKEGVEKFNKIRKDYLESHANDERFKASNEYGILSKDPTNIEEVKTQQEAFKKLIAGGESTPYRDLEIALVDLRNAINNLGQNAIIPLTVVLQSILDIISIFGDSKETKARRYEQNESAKKYFGWLVPDKYKEHFGLDSNEQKAEKEKQVEAKKQELTNIVAAKEKEFYSQLEKDDPSSTPIGRWQSEKKAKEMAEDYIRKSGDKERISKDIEVINNSRLPISAPVPQVNDPDQSSSQKSSNVISTPGSNPQSSNVIPFPGQPNIIGKSGGSRSWRNNNPGNLEYNEYTKSLGAVGSDGRFAIFPDEATGDKARENMLFEGKNYKDLTLSQAVNRYAPGHENNVPAYINAVQSGVGPSFDPNKRMSEYTPEERNAVLKSMKKHEGWKEGSVAKVNSDLPIKSGESVVQRTNQEATRNQDITPELDAKVTQAIKEVYGEGYTAQLYSGGQDKKGEGRRRIGSIRHDEGKAGDFYIVGPDGKRVTGDALAPLGQYWTANKMGGVGMEMKGGGIHLDQHTDLPPAWNYANSKDKGRYTAAQRDAVSKGLKGIQPELKPVEYTPTPEIPKSKESTNPIPSTNNQMAGAGTGSFDLKIVHQDQYGKRLSNEVTERMSMRNKNLRGTTSVSALNHQYA
jgi:hypothetical protein